MQKEVTWSSASDEYSEIGSHMDYSRCVYTWREMVLGEILLPEDFVQGHKEQVFAMDICDK